MIGPQTSRAKPRKKRKICRHRMLMREYSGNARVTRRRPGGHQATERLGAKGLELGQGCVWYSGQFWVRRLEQHHRAPDRKSPNHDAAPRLASRARQLATWGSQGPEDRARRPEGTRTPPYSRCRCAVRMSRLGSTKLPTRWLIRVDWIRALACGRSI